MLTTHRTRRALATSLLLLSACAPPAETVLPSSQGPLTEPSPATAANAIPLAGLSGPGQWAGNPAVLYEVTHVLGWSAQTHGGSVARNSSITGAATGRCTTFLPASASLGPIPPNVCPHEVEVINRAYTSGWSPDQDELFNQEILMGTDASPRSLSVAVGASATIAAPHWQSWPSDQLVSRTPYDLGWSVAPSTLATVSGPGGVTGSQAGSGKVLLRAQSAPPPGYALWTPFQLRGDSVELSVTTPPPVSLQVSDIVVRDAGTDAIVSLPITAPGTYAIDAVVIGTPTWTMLQWSVIDSRSPSVTLVDSTYAPNVRHTFTAYPGDSYSRRFTMRPFSGGTEGFYHIRDIPICVTGGNQLLANTKTSSKSGPVPNMVGGCF